MGEEDEKNNTSDYVVLAMCQALCRTFNFDYFI